MNLITLYQQALLKVNKNENEVDLAYLEKAETLRTALRALGVLPLLRRKSSTNLHMALVHMLIDAEEKGQTIDVLTRSIGDWHNHGITTVLLSWLDKAVAVGLLKPEGNRTNAKGRLAVTPMLSQLTGVACYATNEGQTEGANA